jgi:TetR/AcrR family transcriptional repressor of nem operon
VDSARSRIHEQGAHRTTLAHVAERSGVPLGNVYYYFKTKDDLVRAVLDGYADEAAALIASFEGQRTPQARLKALVRTWVAMREDVAEHGCPMGSLCSELGKSQGALDGDGARVLRLVVDWAEEQFRQLGRRDARDLAHRLFAGIQGGALLANAFREPEILSREARRLERWIDSLA